ncbi:MAG TPA: asparagine synthase (glutamine-hydrolyzing) [Bryobacteraceae bacterium]|nr:asparagine synthase (glutamine-hydrolyzing) [Bryobacteraceae bacterium]
MLTLGHSARLPQVAKVLDEARSMCGIAGYVLLEGKADLDLVRAMCDRIRHRGPDDEGFLVDGGCALGMRRLSIIDLSTGHQPMANEDHSVWVVYNGEVYNYRELRPGLEARGHRFQTHSDTETLVHLYEEEGPTGVARLRGMYAYAIWDARRRRLFLARDRFGKKPLYYAALPQGLFFASEISALRQAGVPLDPDSEALKLYFQFNYIPDPWTAYRAIRKLPAGSWLTYDANGNLNQQRYWRLPRPAMEPPPGLTEEQAAQQLRDKFDEAVRIRLMSDVPLGAFLSGGIDSSSVVASMARQSREPVKTFSIGFEETGFNELPYAELVAKQYQTDHHQILVQPDSVSLVHRLVDHFGEPFGDSSAIPTFIVSEFAAQHVKVALSGDGGDELFGGYDSFVAVSQGRLDRMPAALRAFAARAAEALPYASYGKNYLRMISRPSALERYFEFNYAPYFLRERLLEPKWMMPADAGFLMRTFDGCLLPEGTDPLSQAMYFEANANLTGDMLVKVDRMSMAASLEVRCPMLDHELAELAAALPHRWKIAHGKGKQILLKALGDRLPAELLSRPKRGFGVPLEHWFRGSLRDLLWTHLTAPRFLDRGIVSIPFVRRLLAEHQSRRRDNQHWLWALLMLEMWFQQMEQPISPSLTPAA